MATSKSDDRNVWNLYHHLIDRKLLVAIDARAPAVAKEGDDSTASLLRLGNSAGEAAVLAFTDVEALNRWRVGCPFLEVPARVLFQNLIPLKVDVLILNIGGPIDAIVRREVFGSLAQGIVPVAKPTETINLPAGARMYFRPASGATALSLLKPLRLTMQSMSGIVEAYLLEQRAAIDEPESPVLVVGFAPSIGTAEKKVMIDQLGAVPSQLLPPDRSLLIQELNLALRNYIKDKMENLAIPCKSASKIG